MGLSKDYIEAEMRYDPAGGGVVEYIDPATQEVIAIVLKGGTVADLRQHPPFLATSPCPFCGAINNRGHNNSKHVDPFLGTISLEHKQ